MTKLYNIIIWVVISFAIFLIISILRDFLCLWGNKDILLIVSLEDL